MGKSSAETVFYQLLNGWFGAHPLYYYFLKSMQLLMKSVTIKLEALQIQKPYCKYRTSLRSKETQRRWHITKAKCSNTKLCSSELSWNQTNHEKDLSRALSQNDLTTYIWSSCWKATAILSGTFLWNRK